VADTCHVTIPDDPPDFNEINPSDATKLPVVESRAATLLRYQPKFLLARMVNE